MGAGRRGQHHLPQGDRQAADPVAKRAELIEDYKDKFANPYVAAGLGYVDEVIAPGDPQEAAARPEPPGEQAGGHAPQETRLHAPLISN